jgi:hypothetical protein
MNLVKIDLKIETEVCLSSNGEFFIKERPVVANSFVSVYITYGNVSCYLGTVEDGLTARGQAVIDHTPMGRFGQADDLLGCVRWLLSEDSGFVTGATIPVDGGFLTLGGV